MLQSRKYEDTLFLPRKIDKSIENSPKITYSHIRLFFKFFAWHSRISLENSPLSNSSKLGRNGYSLSKKLRVIIGPKKVRFSKQNDNFDCQLRDFERHFQKFQISFEIFRKFKKKS